MRPQRTCRLRAAVLLGIAAGLAAVVAAGSARASRPADNFVYRVSPFVQPVDNGSGAYTFTNPYCSTRTINGVTAPTLVCYTPSDMRTAYDYPSGLDGSGQTIVIVDAYGSPTVQQDLATFDAKFGLPAPPGGLKVVCPDGCPTFQPNNGHLAELLWAEETSLDVQWSHAMAPGTKLVLVVAPSPAGNSINDVEQKISRIPPTGARSFRRASASPSS